MTHTEGTTKMRKQRDRIRIASLAAGLAVLGACKPKGAGSALNSIAGDDAGGRSAITVVGLRNFSSARVPTSTGSERQVQSMISTRVFWEVECVPWQTKSGATVQGDQLAALIDARSLIDDLYVDANRLLFTSADDQRLVQAGDAQPNKITLPCHLYGSHALTADVLTDLMLKASGMPAALPTTPGAQDGLSRVFIPAQTLFLATRAPTNKADTTQVKLQQLLEMLRDQRGVDTSRFDYAGRLSSADAVYNPCTTGPTPLAWAAQWKTVGFTCPTGQTAASFLVRSSFGSMPAGTYQPCGGGLSAYNCVKDLLATSISGSYDSIYGKQARSNVDALWRILTSATPWSQQGGIGNFLATGGGLNLASEFPAGPVVNIGQNAIGAGPGAPLLVSLTATVYSRTASTGISGYAPVDAADASGASRGGLLAGQPVVSAAESDTANGRAEASAAPTAVRAALQDTATLKAQIPNL